MVDPNILYGFDEESLTQIIVWVALIIYNAVAYSERNPLYGSLYIWVALAIRSKLYKLHPDLTSLIDDLTTITGIQIVSMVVLWTLLAAEVIYDLDAPSSWNTGIFYGI